MSRISVREFDYGEKAQERAFGSVERRRAHTEPREASPMAPPRAELPAGWRWVDRGPQYAAIDRHGTRLSAASEDALLELIDRFSLPSSRRRDPRRDEVSRSLISERYRN